MQEVLTYPGVVYLWNKISQKFDEKNTSLTVDSAPTSATVSYVDALGNTKNHIVGDKRVVPNNARPSGQDIYILVSITQGVASWINLNDNPDLAVINRAFPSNWRTNGTMAQLITDINNDTAAIKGRSYLATVSLSDLPSNLLQAEMLVYITDELAGQGKVIFFMITSNNTAPYHWEYTSAYGATGAWRSFALNDHTHGNITNDGKLQTTDINIASGDKLVVTDSSDNNKISRTSAAFDGITTSKALTPKGTFEDFLQEDDIADLATKVENATSGNLAGLNSDGNITDSGISASNVLTVANKGVANGVASLDASGKVPSSQLPSYVDDVVELLTMASSAPVTCAAGDLYFNTTSGKIFTASGTNTWGSTGANPEKSKIYTDLSTNITYRWGGSTMVEISKGLEIGTTTGTAADGKVVNDHVNNTNNPHGVTKSQVGLGNVGNFKAVSTEASQGLTDTEKSNARSNIGAASAEQVAEMEDVTAAALTDLDERTKKAVETTWAELVALRDSQQLIPGMWYRITDYQTTTTQAATQSAGHQFDIIVRADDVNVLNENAYAAKHSGDTYFTNAGAKLEAWELKYCLDNDTNKYAWADGTNGKGVIYWMKDEWDNECPYDFKNIMFKPGAKTQAGTVADVFYYTFSVASGTNDASVTDNSLNGAYCYGNSIGVYISSNKSTLSKNVFRNTSNTYECYSNVLGNNNRQNTFGNRYSSNTFGNNCANNVFGNNCANNVFGNTCANNVFLDSCQYNKFGDSCSSNTFGNYCTYNTFGNYCKNNTFGNYCKNNKFGNYCECNTFMNSCAYIVFGTSSAVKDYVQYVIVENGNKFIYLDYSATTSSSSPMINVKIAQGVNNSSTYKTITHTTAGDIFQTIYKPANSVEVSV